MAIKTLSDISRGGVSAFSERDQQQFIDAEWYSLNGNGTTDDTAVVRQIVADAVSRGIMRIQFPAGEFAITPDSSFVGVPFTTSGITLAGAGKRSTSTPTLGPVTEFVWLGTNTGSCFKAGGPNTTDAVANLSFERFSIHMQNTGATAFVGERMANSYFDRVGLNYGGRGLHIHTSSFANSFHWLEVYHPGQYGILVENLSHKNTFLYPKVWGGPGVSGSSTNPEKNPIASMVVGSGVNGIAGHCSKLDIVSADLETHRVQVQLWLQDVRSFDVSVYTEAKETTDITKEVFRLGELSGAAYPQSGQINYYAIGNYSAGPPVTGGERLVRIYAGKGVDFGGFPSFGLEVFMVHNATGTGPIENIRFLQRGVKSSSVPWTLGAGHAGISVPTATTRVSRAAAQSLSSGIITTITFDTEILDEGLVWTSGSATRLTVPALGGYKYIQIRGTVSFAANATGTRNVSIRKNGTGSNSATEVGGQGASAFPGGATMTYLTFDTGLMDAVSGDYYEMRAHQSGGVALDTFASVTCELS